MGASAGGRAAAKARRISNRLPAFRAERGMTQGDLAESVGTATSHISRLECGYRDPGLPLALEIARELGARVEDIWAIEGER